MRVTKHNKAETPYKFFAGPAGQPGVSFLGTRISFWGADSSKTRCKFLGFRRKFLGCKFLAAQKHPHF